MSIQKSPAMYASLFFVHSYSMPGSYGFRDMI